MLSLYEDEDSIIHNLSPNDTNRSKGFLEKSWGKKATFLQGTISHLEAQNWALIKDHTYAHFGKVKLLELEEEMPDGKDEDLSYLHAHLII